MQETKLTEKINDNPKRFVYIGGFVFVLGIALNMFNSAMLKPIYVDSSTMGNIVCNILSAVTAFMAVLGFVVFTNSLTAMKNAKQKKVVKRNKKRKK